MRVRWTDQALERLAEIEDFIARDDAVAAMQLVLHLIERAEGLAEFPEMGRALPELPGSGLRELVEGNYRVVYRVRGKAVEVITAFEGHRLLRVEDVT